MVKDKKTQTCDLKFFKLIAFFQHAQLSKWFLLLNQQVWIPPLVLRSEV